MRITNIKPLQSAEARSAFYCAGILFDCAERAKLDGNLDLADQLCNAAVKHFQASRDLEARYTHMLDRLAAGLQRA